MESKKAQGAMNDALSNALTTAAPWLDLLLELVPDAAVDEDGVAVDGLLRHADGDAAAGDAHFHAFEGSQFRLDRVERFRRLADLPHARGRLRGDVACVRRT